MNRESVRPLHVILLALGACGLAAFVFLAVNFLRASKYSADLAYTFESMDTLINNGGYAEAQKLAEALRPQSPGDWLRLLKRCRVLAERGGMTELFADKALAASRANAEDEELAAVAVLALTGAGKTTMAAETAAGLRSLEYRSVKAEAFVRAGIVPQEDPEGEMLYAFLLQSRDPALFLRAGEMSAEPDFFLDAALLLMEAGSRDAALEILSRPPVGAAHPYITALASYDVENFADSDAYWDLMPSDFKMMPEALALRADSFLRQRRYAESENFHEILLQNYPRYSALPYRNSVFFQHRRKPWSGFSFLQRSLPIFPENYSLALDYAKSLAALGRREESRAEGEKIFAAFSARADEVSREDTLAAEDTRVLALVTEREDIPLARFVGGLWFLRNDYPDNPSIPALLRPHLLSQHDYTALRTLLTETEADSHSLSYLAGLSIVEKDLPAARELLRRQTEKFPLCPEGFYNLGLVEQELAQGEAALAAFRTAEECALYADSPGFEEKNFLKITEALISLNRLPEAHSLLMEFLDAHPENPAALHNLRKLEAKTK